MAESLLADAITLAREGRRAEARWLLRSIVEEEPANETAWLWLADCAETIEGRIEVLETCLLSNPGAARARAGLELLESRRNRVDSSTAATAVLDRPEPAPTESAQEGEVPGTAALSAAITQPVRSRPAPADDRLTMIPQSGELAPAQNPPLPLGQDVFTVPLEAVTPEEFHEIETRTEKALESRPLLRWRSKRKPRKEAPAAQPNWSELSLDTSWRLDRAPDEIEPVEDEYAPALSREGYLLLYAGLAFLVVILAAAAIVFLLV